MLNKVLLLMPTIYEIKSHKLLDTGFARRGICSECPPLGLGYIASSLQQIGCKVKIFDILGRDEQLPDVINQFSPDIIGVSTITTSYPEFARTVRQIRKQARYDGILVAGGLHITVEPQKSFEQLPLDACVVGEGEQTMSEIIEKGLSKSVKGILLPSGFTGYRGVVKNLDNLPFPAYDLYEMNLYPLLNEIFPIVPMRGCPYRCTYCSVTALFGRKVRFRSPENVAQEMAFVKDKYGFNKFIMHAGTFVANKKWIKEFADVVEPLNISFRCTGRINLMDDDLFSDLKRSGCYLLGYGVETIVQRISDNIDKSQRVKDIPKIIKKTTDYGIRSRLHFMLSLPGEKISDMKKTIDFSQKIAKKHGCSRAFHITSVYSGTPLANKVNLRDHDWTQIIHPELPYPNVPIYKELDYEIIYEMWLKANEPLKLNMFEKFNKSYGLARLARFYRAHKELSKIQLMKLFFKKLA